MIGLKKGTVRLYSFDKKWHNAFLREKNVLEKCLDNNFIVIEHVGSTAIPGVLAKPIIDIAIGTKNRKYSLICKSLIKKLGYNYRGEVRKGEFFFAKGPENKRTIYIRIVVYKSKTYREYIIFRDVLKSDKRLIKQYNVLKQKLAALYKNNREEYTKRKDPFIKMVLKK